MFRPHDERTGRTGALIATVILLFAACAPADPDRDTPPGPAAADTAATTVSGQTGQQSTMVIMLGDSLTAGYRLTPDEALPSALERRLRELGLSVTMVNAGVSGDTTADALNRYEFSVAASNPDLLVIAIGANDFLNGLDPRQARENIARLLEKAQEDGIPAALVGLTPPETSEPRGALLSQDFDYSEIYPELARSYGAPLFPNMLARVAGRPELLQDDGLHPTAEGVEAIAEDMTPFLEPLVRGAAASPAPE
ncbi:MAG: arylesterase [Alphaproteobacteria bacterium]|nr:arylesterase [Alphaproteobacteria bacterium]